MIELGDCLARGAETMNYDRIQLWCLHVIWWGFVLFMVVALHHVLTRV